MNTEPNRTEQLRQTLLAQLQKFPRRLWNFVSQNWPWKLLALFLAVCLWAGLIAQDRTLTRERTFTDATLNITGAESLKRNSSLIVIGGLEPENLNVRLRVEVPQHEYSSVAFSNYNPRVDLTRITEAGEQKLKVVTTSSTTYGSVQDVSPSTINVVVDEYVTNYRVPVLVNVTGSYPEGFYGGGLSSDPSVVAVSGPKSVVDQIVRIGVDFDLSRLSPRAGLVRSALPIRFLDRNGDAVESDLLEVVSSGVVLRTIIVEQTLYPTRMIDLSTAALTSGTPAKGYRVSSVSISPASLLAAGDEEALAAVEELLISEPVDVTGRTETFAATVRARKPADLTYLSTETICVTVGIEPEIISRTFDNVKLSVRGAASSMKTALDNRSASIVITGPQLLLEGLRSGKVSAFVDASGLEAGEHVLPVQLHVEEADMSVLSFSATPATVTVTLTEK